MYGAGGGQTRAPEPRAAFGIYIMAQTDPPRAFVGHRANETIRTPDDVIMIFESYCSHQRIISFVGPLSSLGPETTHPLPHSVSLDSRSSLS